MSVWWRWISLDVLWRVWVGNGGETAALGVGGLRVRGGVQARLKGRTFGCLGGAAQKTAGATKLQRQVASQVAVCGFAVLMPLWLCPCVRHYVLLPTSSVWFFAPLHNVRKVGLRVRHRLCGVSATLNIMVSFG